VSYVIETAASVVVKAIESIVTPVNPLENAEFINANKRLLVLAFTATPTATSTTSIGTLRQLISQEFPNSFKAEDIIPTTLSSFA
jgi:hypothetical protein